MLAEVHAYCRLKHQPLFHGTEHNLKTFLSNDNQTGIAWLLYGISGKLGRIWIWIVEMTAVELVFCSVSICAV